LSDNDKNDNTITADIPESVFEEALRAVENIQAEARKKDKDAKAQSKKDESVEIDIPAEEDTELIDLMELLEEGEAQKPAAGKKPSAKADVNDSDLSVLSRLLEEEYNLEKEANFFKNVLFDSLKEDEAKIDDSLLKEKESQIKQLLERLSKLQSEFEKFRSRLTKETETAKKFSNESLILQILPILDNLERAIEHADSSEEKSAMVQGVRLIHKQLLDTMIGDGVSVIEAKGKGFDPQYHDAIVMLETKEVAPNIVISEYLRGYMLHDRLLRPAKVVVSRAPEDSSKESESEEVDKAEEPQQNDDDSVESDDEQST